MMKCHDFKMHRDTRWPRLNVSSKILGNEMSKTKGQASIKIPSQLQLHFNSFYSMYSRSSIRPSELSFLCTSGWVSLMTGKWPKNSDDLPDSCISVLPNSNLQPAFSLAATRASLL